MYGERSAVFGKFSVSNESIFLQDGPSVLRSLFGVISFTSLN